MDEGHEIGRRLREIRSWRDLNIRAVADLSGLSFGYVAKIERGEKSVSNRNTLEKLANALRVSPTELTGKPYAPSDAASAEAHAAMFAVADALTGWWLGDIPDAPGRPWPEVQADLDRLYSTLVPHADYAAVTTLVPGLIRDLLAATTEPEHRRAALVGLLKTYQSAAYVAYHLGFAGLPMLGVEQMRRVAEELDDPAWSAQVAWERANVLNGTNRVRQYELAVAATDTTAARPETRGMANLTAALAAAAQGQGDLVQTHLTAAAELAELIDGDVSEWALTAFGRTNVGIWAVTIGVELGQGARVAEIASTVRPETIGPARQAVFYADLGRGLASERPTREQGVRALARAEKIAPQRIRNNAFVRETVSDLLTRVNRDSTAGRELRGMAYRMGLAPIG